MAKLMKIGTKYRMDFSDETGKRHRTMINISNKKKAKEIFNKTLADVAEGKFLDKKNQVKIKFGYFATKYIDGYSKLHKISWDKDVSRLKTLKKFFGNKYLFQINRESIAKYKVMRNKEVSPATVNRELALIKHMYTIAIEWGKVNNNPVKQVKLFKEKNRRLRYLEMEEIERLLQNCSGYLKNIIIIALHTGMRKGEILGLKWDDIDMKRGFIYLLNTKNGEKREVPMNDDVRMALINQPKHKTSSYVFCHKNGKPFRNVRKSFLAVLKKSGIMDFRFHDLRHTFASHLVMDGENLNTVRELMGHKSLRMTLRYAHLSDKHKKRAVDNFARKMARFRHSQDEKEAESIDSVCKSLVLQ